MTRAPETLGAWVLGVGWGLPLAHPAGTAFPPPEYSHRPVPSAPPTPPHIAHGWAAGPLARPLRDPPLPWVG